MRRFILGFSFLIALAMSAYAQPANDPCAMPTPAPLDGSCITTDFVGATFDLANGDCAPTPGAPNIWYTFVAQGPDLDIIVNPVGGTMHVALLVFDPIPCDFGSAAQLACGIATGGEILGDIPLFVGQTYYLVVNFSDGAGTPIEGTGTICVLNEVPLPPPPNDEGCSPQVVTANGTCTPGTTNDATQEFSAFPGCSFAPESGVFYEWTATPGNLAVDIDVNSVSLGGEVLVALGQWNPNCNGTYTYVDFYCGAPGQDLINYSGIVAGQTYVVFIGTDENEEGDFEVCISEFGPPPGCSENNVCTQSDIIPGVSSNNTAYSCIDGCNILASPEPTLGGCNFATEEVVWYNFQSDGSASFLTIDLNSLDIEAPSVQIFSGPCNNLNALSSCVTGANGNAQIINNNIPSNTQIYIAVSNSFGEGGDFELCVLMQDDPSTCVLDAAIEVTGTSLGSPLDGPFQPGETVSFCYTIDEYDATQANTGCQWLQGIIPIFGPGWSDLSFDAQGMPVSSTPFGAITAYNGNWGWYTNITYNTTLPMPASKSVGDFDGDGDIEMCHFTEPDCPNTGIAANQIMPPGWYAWTPNGAPDGNPNIDWGDGAGCNVQTGPWQICFDLITLTFEECDAEDPQITDTSVKIYTTSDGETGDWNGGISTCASDAPQISSTQLNCCIGPEVDPITDVLCPGTSTDLVLSSDQDGDVTYFWTVQPNGSVTGYFDGEGNFIGQVLENNTSNIQIVNYEVTAISEEGCFGLPTIIPVTVLPAIEVDAGDPIDGCAQGEFDLGGSPTATGGDGSFSYDWGNAAVPNVSNPTASPNVSTIYTVTVTDGNGCTSTDDVELTINPRFDVEITGDTILCPDLPVTTLSGSPLGGTPNYSFEWTGQGTGNSQNQNLNFNGSGLPTGDYFITLTVTDDNGCTGDQEVLVDIFNDPSIFIVAVPESGKFCPGGSIQVNALAVNGEPNLNYNYTWTTPSGGTQNGTTIIADETGWYKLLLEDPIIFCSKLDSIFLEEIQPPEPILMSPPGVCQDEMVYITLDTIYNSYEWSTNETTDSILVMPGTYTVTVTNEADCEGEATITVNPFPPVSAAIGGSSAFCEGSSTTLNVSSNFDTYEWTDADGNIISTADTAFVTMEGLINVTVIDANGCPANASIDVVIQDFLVPNVTGDTSICPQACTDLNAGSGYSQYEWSTTEVTQIITVCEPGDYTVTVYDAGGCTGEQVKTITVNDLPTPEIIGEDGEESFCPGDDIVLDAGAGYISYLWSDDSGNQTLTVAVPGTYVVTVTDAEGCQNTAEIEIEENTPPAPTFDGNLSFCPGDSVEITPEGGYSLYEIDIDNNGSIDLIFENNDPFTVSIPGNSNIVVTDTAGCQGEVIVTTSLFTPPSPQGVIDTASFCTDGTVNIAITSDYNQVEWYLDNVLQGMGQNITVSTQGTYDILVTDDNGCVGNTSLVVIESTQLFPFIVGDDQICDFTPTVLDAGPNYDTYDWGDFGDTQTITVDSAGTYVVMVFDAGGCSGTAEFVVTNSATPTAVVEPEVFVCNNNDGENEAFLNFNDLVVGANGFWIDQDGLGVDLSDLTNVDFSGILPGFYTFVYETSIAIDPCEDQSYALTLEVNECLCPSVTINDLAPLCLDGNIVDLDTLKVTTEDGFWSVESGGGNPLTGSIFDPNAATAGDYILTFNLLNPSDNCDEFSSINLTVFAPPNPGTPTDPLILCVGNEDDINLPALLDGEDLNGIWVESSTTPSSGGAFDAASGSFDITDQAIGSYTFDYIVNGTLPCVDATATVEVIVGALPIAEAGDNSELDCDMLEVSLDGGSSSGNSLSFVWTETKGLPVENSTNSTIVVTEAGVYMLEVTDQFQCTDMDSVIVGINTDFPSLTLEGNDPFCFGEANGSVVADGLGGSGPYTYSFDGGTTFLEQNAVLDLTAGTYTVIVQDQNLCTGEEVITIEDPAEFQIDLGGNLILQNVEDTLISLDILSGSTDLEAAVWTVDGSIVCEGLECMSYVVDLSVDRTVCVIATTSDGCIDSTCVELRSIRINDAYIGNTFTPNDDGVNDVFFIQGGEDIEQVNLFRIYNRWGELIFSEEDFEPGNPDFGWTGRFKDRPVNPGVYAYTAEVLFKNGDIEVYNGDVTVVK